MTAVQTAIADAGLALQSAKGSAATNPQYEFGLTGGNVAQVEIDQSLEDRTSGARVAPHVNRTAAMPGQAYTTRAWPDLIGLMLYGALGGYSVTGAGPTYDHTIVPAGSLPYLTGWGSQDGAHYRLDDAKLGDLELSWDGNAPLEVSTTLLGINLTPGVSDPTPDAEVACAGHLTPVGGTFEVDVDGTSPAAAPITGGSISLVNGLTGDPISGAITPDDIEEARLEVGVSLTLKAEDVNEWREAVYGSAAGTDISQVAVFGSFEVAFTDGTNTLTVTASKVAFLCSLPDVSPSGGPGEIVLEGMVVACPDDDAITFELTNAVADYTA